MITRKNRIAEWALMDKVGAGLYAEARARGDVGIEYPPEWDEPTESDIAKAAAAMTRLRRSRQLHGGLSKARQRHIDHVLARQRGEAVPKPAPYHRGQARAAGTGESVLVFADRPGHGPGLYLMRGTVVQSKAIARRSHWYGGLGR